MKGELVNRNSREEPVCSKHSEGLVDESVGALPPVLRGELVNEKNREKPVCSKCRDGLVDESVGALPPVLKGELVKVSGWARLHKQ